MDNDWRDRVTFDPDILKGKPTIKGTRISVELILELLANGWTEQKITENYPQLKKDDIHAALRYALDILKEKPMYPYSLIGSLPGLPIEVTKDEIWRDFSSQKKLK
jgi:uncharacterized protein (DUF433 family)